jgi:hypothetical protein
MPRHAHTRTRGFHMPALLSTVVSLSRCPSRAELQAMLHGVAPELLRDASRYLTALVYLASRSRPSVDRVAMLLGCDREFVARRARRWADHGLWNTPLPDDQLTSERLSSLVDIGEGIVPRVAPPETLAYVGHATDEGEDGDVLLDALWRGLGLAEPDDWDRLVA